MRMFGWSRASDCCAHWLAGRRRRCGSAAGRGERQYAVRGVEGAALRLLLHGPHRALFLRGLARQDARAAPGTRARAAISRCRALGCDETAPRLGLRFTWPKLEHPVLFPALPDAEPPTAIAAGRLEVGGGSLRALYPDQRCVSESRHRRLRVGRGVCAADPAQIRHPQREAGHYLRPLSSERQPLSHSRRDTASGRQTLTASHLDGIGSRDIEAQRGQAVSPDAARIEAGDIGVLKEPQRRPMTEDDARAAPAGGRRLEPGDERLRLRFLRRSLGAQAPGGPPHRRSAGG